MAAHDDIKSPREDTPLLQQESPGQATPKAPLPSWLQTLIDAFSCKLLFTVVCTQHVLKGFVAGGGDSGLLGAPMEFLFKEYRVHGGRMQVYMAVAVSPWALKPVIGLLSDTCPIFGYQKMPYIVISLVAGLIAVLVLGLYGANLELSELICCLFVAFFAVSSVDLLVKAAQSSKVKKAVHLSHDFFLFTWLGIVVGMIASALLVGPLLHYWSPRHCYLVALPFLGLSLWPALANYLGEQPLPLEDRTQLMAANFRKHPEMFILALCMALVLIGIVIATLTLSKEKDVEFPQFMMSFVGACIILASLAIFIRWEITGPCIFWFNSASLSKGGWSFVFLLHRWARCLSWRSILLSLVVCYGYEPCMLLWYIVCVLDGRLPIQRVALSKHYPSDCPAARGRTADVDSGSLALDNSKLCRLRGSLHPCFGISSLHVFCMELDPEASDDCPRHANWL